MTTFNDSVWITSLRVYNFTLKVTKDIEKLKNVQ